MLRISVIVAVSAIAILLAANGAWAADITIPDTVGSGSGWYGAQEDNEVEPGNVTGQAWDVESVLLTGNSLTLVGGWDFQNGRVDNDWTAISGGNWDSGDVFLSFSSLAPLYGATAPGPQPLITNNIYKYDMTLAWNRDSSGGLDGTGNFDFIALTPSATLQLASVYGGNGLNWGSNPYMYVSGGEDVGDGTATFGTLTAAEATALGLSPSDTHNTVTFTLPTVSPELWVHFTEECGNDNLMGHQVPEPFSMVMLGCLGIGMIGARKARQLRKAAKQ